MIRRRRGRPKSAASSPAAFKRQRVAERSEGVIDLCDSDTEDEAPSCFAEEDPSLALARRLQAEEYSRGGVDSRHAHRSSAAPNTTNFARGLNKQSRPSNPLELDFSRCEVLRRMPTPVLCFRAVGGALAGEAAALAAPTDKGSGRRCGAAVNSGTKPEDGKNCTDTYRVLADTTPMGGPGSTRLDAAALMRWQRRVVEPVMAAAMRALGDDGDGGDAATSTLRELGPSFADGSPGTAELGSAPNDTVSRLKEFRIEF